MAYTLVEKAKIRLRQFHKEQVQNTDGTVETKVLFDNPEEDIILEELCDNAISSVKIARGYPSSYTEAQIEADLEQFSNVIVNLIIYDYNKEGMDFENGHTEGGVTRQFTSRDKILASVLPFVDFF